MIDFCNYCEHDLDYIGFQFPDELKEHCAKCTASGNNLPTEFELNDNMKKLFKMWKERKKEKRNK